VNPSGKQWTSSRSCHFWLSNRCTVLLALAVTVFLFPSIALADEGVRFIEAGQRLEEVDSLGGWSEEDGAVSAQPTRESKSGYWLPRSIWIPAPRHVSVRLDDHKHLELGVLLDARLEDGALLGHNVRISGKQLLIERLERNEVVVLGEADIKGLGKKGGSVELHIWASEDWIVAQLQGKRVAAVLTVGAKVQARSRLGLRRQAGVRARGSVRELSMRPLCPIEQSSAMPRSFFATVRSSDWNAVIDGLPLIEPMEQLADQTVLKVQLETLGALYCAGVEPVELFTETPLKYVDPAFLSERRRTPRRSASGFVIDASYKDSSMVRAILRGYQQRFPELSELVELGRSHQGRPILALAIGRERSGTKPSILLNGSHHGDEPLSTEIVLDAVQQLLECSEDPEISAFLDEFVIWCVPLVNPDGNAMHVERSLRRGRKNGRDLDDDGIIGLDEGVDLNRNYPFRWGETGEEGSRSKPTHPWFRGPSAASEPETKAMMALAEQERFVASISYHTGTVAVLAPYTINEVPNPEPNEAWVVAEELISRLPSPVKGRDFPLRRQLYSVDGTDQDWHRYTHGTLALLVEASPDSPIDLEKRQRAIVANRASWMGLLQRWVDGPGLVVQVLNDRGEAVQAELSIDELPVFAGEKWRTRCRDGRFFRYLPARGRYTVRARVAGAEATKEVDVRNFDGEVVIILEGAEGGGRSCESRVLRQDLIIAQQFVRASWAGLVANWLAPPPAAEDGVVREPAPMAVEAEAPQPLVEPTDSGCGCRQTSPLRWSWWAWLLVALTLRWGSRAARLADRRSTRRSH
jgi:hypothetical protein